MQQNAHYADRGGYRKPLTRDWRYHEEAVHQRPAPSSSGNRLRWPDRLLIALVALLLLGLHLRADAAQAPVTLDDIAAGAFLANTQAPGEYLPLAGISTRALFDVTGPLVRASVKQVFRNDSGDWLEGVYVHPLPEGVAVDHLRLVVGGRVVEGEIRERASARKSYEEARDSGQVAGLVEQERPNLFTTSVANVAPGDEILVEIGFQYVIRPRDGVYELRFPLTLTPRHVPPPAPDVETLHKLDEILTDISRITVPMAVAEYWEHPVDISVHIDAGLPLLEVRSHHHDIIMEPETDDRYTIILADESIPADRDFLLSWSVATGTGTEAAVFAETVGQERFALVLLTPPRPEQVPVRPSRDLIFVIDTSGSMHGESMRQARDALVTALDRLDPGDRFEIIEFNSSAHALFGGVVSAQPYFIRTAQQFVQALRADGGTNISAALDLALNPHHESRGRVRQVVFITDGSVGNESALFRQISRDLGDARLFTVGIGSAPNTWFMKQAARFGRGSYSFIGSVSEVAERMERLFTTLELPALTGLTAEWSLPAESFPDPVPDVYAGEPVLIAARLPAGQTVLELTGDNGWMRRIHLEDGAANHPGIARLWARWKIEDLENLEVMGADPDDIRKLVLETALGYGLVSRYTSLVAVEKTPVRLASADLRREHLPAMSPAGSVAHLPATATNAPLWTFIGSLLAAFGFAWMLFWWRVS